jgi:predicted type IV restriction endonuclease
MAAAEKIYGDWGEASPAYDEVLAFVEDRDLASLNEAQTRYDVIDRMLRDILSWKHGHVDVEEHLSGAHAGYIDYLLRLGDYTIVVEAKRFGAAFPNPSARTRLKLSGSLLGTGEISEAINQAERYAGEKGADIVIVTNGTCWCFYSMAHRSPEDYATLLFPFKEPSHAEHLFNCLSQTAVESGSILRITNQMSRTEDRLLSAVKDSDGRIDRNNIADHITPALNNAMYADSLINNVEALDKCFVTTHARSKFDALLGMHLSDPKPISVSPARRIKTGMPHGHLEKVVETCTPGFAPPVTLIIGPVGAGKSTYLRHFELLAGREILSKVKAHWIYIDFEEMGKHGDPRSFIYSKLRDYLLAEHPSNPTDYNSLVKPAYEKEIGGLARGPLAPIYNNKDEFNRRIVDYIQSDFQAVEPYVDKVLRFLCKTRVCIIVLDNVDLYEDDQLETSVFSEGLALSKRVLCHVIVSLRDRTYVRHRTDSSFDAYETRKLWLDPPSFRTVLSSRLTFSKKILEGRSAQVQLPNGMHLAVPDLSVFFDIVQRSILQGQAGEFIESISDLNIRRGLTLITNFLTSGHIQADRAISKYIKGYKTYSFPFHEIFKGTMLAQWRHYKEDRSDCINIFDSRLGVHKLRLLRLHILAHLVVCAQREESLEVGVEECVSLFSNIGASENHTIATLQTLQKNGLIRSVTAEDITLKGRIVVSKSGGYYAKILSHRFVYVESCLVDTAIGNYDTWNSLCESTIAIERDYSIPHRMEVRRDRLNTFLEYLENNEAETLQGLSILKHTMSIPDIRKDAMSEATIAVSKSKEHYD